MRDVAFSCDDGGCGFLLVAVWSLLDRYAGAEPIRVNVFEGFGGHSAAHKEALAEVVSRFPKATLRYHDVEPYLAPYPDIVKGRENSRWNVFTWTPILTPLVLSDAEGAVVHFDIDMLFNADVSPLFEVDFGGALVACVHEYDKYGDNAGRVVWENGILPGEAERYFNTGVLVFNTAACRAERTWERIIEWYRSHVDVADRIEQDAWNALYWERMEVELPRQEHQGIRALAAQREVLARQHAARVPRGVARPGDTPLLGAEEAVEAVAPSVPPPLPRGDARRRDGSAARAGARAALRPAQRHEHSPRPPPPRALAQRRQDLI